MRRVVVTGLGAITPLALDVDGTWKAMLAGKSGVDRIASLDVDGLPTQIAAEVNGFDPASRLDKKAARRESLRLKTKVRAGAYLGVTLAVGRGPGPGSNADRSVT